NSIKPFTTSTVSQITNSINATINSNSKAPGKHKPYIQPDFSVDYLIIGGGVVGLAITNRLSSTRKNKRILLVEKNSKLGIYYPNNSLKTKLCIRGKQLLYELLSSSNLLPYKRIGKWIVAQNEDSQINYLHQLKKKSDDLGVTTYFLSQSEIQSQEPFVNAKEVLVSTTTGIFDSHQFIEWLECKILEKNHQNDDNDNSSNSCDIIKKSKVVNITAAVNDGDGYIVEILNPGGNKTYVHSKIVINSAGLFSDKIANLLMPKEHHYKLYHAKGHYYAYRYNSSVSTVNIKVNHLIYPIPPKNLSSVGIHLTLDLANKIKFVVQAYLPHVKKGNLFADYAGIRPKLQGPNEPFRDFVIKEESEHGLNGFINLVGIESPGLTSSLAIAEMIDNVKFSKKERPKKKHVRQIGIFAAVHKG
ncbi:1754_t:CDS:2, partial [Entrophospora sp. SA101]